MSAASYPAVLVPVPITDAVLTASSLAEPAATETLWVSGATYAVGDRRIRTQTHRAYKRVSAGAGTTPPEDDLANWTDDGPTIRWAAFDTQTSTRSVATTSLSYTLSPGFFNAVALYKVSGYDLAVTIKDAPGGSVVWSHAESLQRPPLDWYDWAFGQIVQQDKVLLTGLTPYPEAEITLTLSAAAGAEVGIGMVALGDLRPILGDQAEWGGTERGASAEPVDYSYVKTDEFGNTTIRKRRSATDMRLSVPMPLASADLALASVQELLGVPACWIATDVAGFAGLNVFGLGSGSLVYEGPSHAALSIHVKGLV